jgi:hypothetical protein
MTSKIAKTATEGLRHLWEDQFFETIKDREAVVAVLAKRGNHFSDSELGMALLRAPYLTRRGKRGNYEYIQKHPFVPSEDGITVKGATK